MAGKDAMGTCSADGEGSTLNMADGDLEDGLIGTVINGEGAVNFFDFDIAHDAVAGHIEQGEIAFLLFLGRVVTVGGVPEVLIIRSGVVQELFVVDVGDIGDGLGVTSDRARLVEGVPVVADCWVQQQGQPCNQDHG